MTYHIIQVRNTRPETLGWRRYSTLHQCLSRETAERLFRSERDRGLWTDVRYFTRSPGQHRWINTLLGEWHHDQQENT